MDSKRSRTPKPVDAPAAKKPPAKGAAEIAAKENTPGAATAAPGEKRKNASKVGMKYNTAKRQLQAVKDMFKS
eukprot:805339-Prymnesium_polylepis.1